MMSLGKALEEEYLFVDRKESMYLDPNCKMTFHFKELFCVFLKCWERASEYLGLLPSSISNGAHHLMKCPSSSTQLFPLQQFIGISLDFVSPTMFPRTYIQHLCLPHRTEVDNRCVVVAYRWMP
jgi:hypothetical protein